MEPRDDDPPGQAVPGKPASPPPRKRRLRMPRSGPLVGKLCLVGIIIFVLNIGVMMVEGLVYERESRFQAVSREIGTLWGGEQTLAGPVLAVPYGVPGDRPGAEYAVEQGVMYLLPEVLEVDGQVAPEVRHRGIFEAVVYTTEASVTGHFRIPDADTLPAFESAAGESLMLLWERAHIAVGIPDMRSIRRVVDVRLNGQSRSFVPGTRMPSLLPSGMSVDLPFEDIPAEAGEQQTLRFEFDLRLNGSRSLAFLPLGRETSVNLSSSWPAPSFEGAFLPDAREIDGDGFRASWTLSHFGRSYGQMLLSESMPADIGAQLAASAFGVKLYQPVTTYRKVQRAIKYGLLFLVFTFGFYFLVEVVARQRIHPIQYAMVGVPLCLFYLLLVAFAEHIGFDVAYVAGAACVVALVSLYSMKVLGGVRRAAVIAMLLSGLYTYLYMLLQQENYSLLGGSLGLLGLTAAFMYATRNVNWYGSAQPSSTQAVTA